MNDTTYNIFRAGATRATFTRQFPARAKEERVSRTGLLILAYMPCIILPILRLAPYTYSMTGGSDNLLQSQDGALNITILQLS